MNEHNSSKEAEVDEETMEALESRYNRKVISHAIFPQHMGTIDRPDGYARITGPCGDTVEVFLRVKSGVTIDAAFTTDGCTSSVAAANAGIDLVVGKSLREARAITRMQILDYLGELPEDDEHCALLAANTIRSAAADCERNQAEPWRKLYRKV